MSVQKVQLEASAPRLEISHVPQISSEVQTLGTDQGDTSTMTYLNISYGLRPPMRFAYGVTTDLTEVHEVASFVHKKVHALTDWAMLPDRSSRVFQVDPCVLSIADKRYLSQYLDYFFSREYRMVLQNVLAVVDSQCYTQHKALVGTQKIIVVGLTQVDDDFVPATSRYPLLGDSCNITELNLAGSLDDGSDTSFGVSDWDRDY
ncbi:hypothetical protein MIR68_003672 [Amoeboaphelidium protococcarum]|nr:hypothetical protein MIR68_003672 [Amoeboaphelidium protococcarum]